MRCVACVYEFSESAGTRFHARKLPLDDLLEIERLHGAGMNAYQISQRLGIGYKTVWTRTRARG